MTRKPSPDPDDELRDELRAHLDHRAEDLRRSGLPPDEADRRARLEFGGVANVTEQCRDERRWAALVTVVVHIWRETRHACRRLLRTPAFTVFAVLSLGLGLGVTSAVYAVMEPILRPGAGMRDVDRLLVLSRVFPGSQSLRYVTSLGDFSDLQASQTTLSGVAAWAEREAPYIDGATAVMLEAEIVTGNAFDVLGIQMTAGRPIVPNDDEPDAGLVVVLSHRFWTTHLRADPTIVGRVVRIGGQPFEVIGVADRAFNGINRPTFVGPMAWIPMRSARAVTKSTAYESTDRRSADSFSVIGRLPAGRTIEEAAAEFSAIGSRLDISHPRPSRSDAGLAPAAATAPRRWSAAEAQEAFGDSGPFSSATLLVGLVALVLLVACTNLANLTLARGSSRQHEIAVRRAMGAPRWRLLREQVIESAVIAILGGAAAIVVARLILVAAASEVPPGVRFDIATSLSPGVMAATGTGLALTLLVFGLWPALQITRPDVRDALTGDAGTGGAIRWRTRRGLIVGQIGVSVAFLFVAAMCVRGMNADAKRESGIDVDRLAIGNVAFRLQGWNEMRARPVTERILETVRALPGVEGVAVTSGLPFGLVAPQADLSTPSEPFRSDKDDYDSAYVVSATPEIFRVLGVPILHGRAFDGRDGPNAPLVAVLSETSARGLFGSIDVVGRQVTIRSSEPSVPMPAQPIAVIGIARETDTRSMGRRYRGSIYVPFAQQYVPSVLVVVRTPAPAGQLIPLRTAIRQADADLVAGSTGTGLHRLGGRYFGLRVLSIIATALGGVALVLAMAGLYGVLSHLVARRTREVGVRMALGASVRDIARMVLGDGLRPVAMGLGVGFLLGVLGRVAFAAMGGLTFSVVDVAAFILVPMPLVLSALLACYLPARRAARVDPNVALRD